MKHLQITMNPGEYWYGLSSLDGMDFPVGGDSEYERDFTINPTPNQIAPLLVSNQGRFLWSDSAYRVRVKNGIIDAAGVSELVLREGEKDLKGAYHKACMEYFAPNNQLPPLVFFEKPQYNTWIELLYDQTQEDVLRYANAIIDNGLPPGILMIDDGWNPYYGHWDFHSAKFPDPKGMVDTLHKMGFYVMLWTCPFVSPDSVEFRFLAEKKYFVMEKNEEPSIKHWWNGYSAVLDFTNPGAQEWYESKIRGLMERYGIDGFKFDAGDANFYSREDVTYRPTDPNTQSELWAEFGEKFAFNEFRACYKCACRPLVQRLQDKLHAWGKEGISVIVPNILAQGILGYAYTCPDMIGGGNISSFWGDYEIDEELFVRYAQAAALMPMMQYSAAPWRVLSAKNSKLCIEAAHLHTKFAEEIKELAAHSAKTGEPIVRYMEYEFPGQGLAAVTDQFMLGSRVLVAPVVEKGCVIREVFLPKGKWKYVDGTIYEGGCVSVPAPIHVLPYFLKVE